MNTERALVIDGVQELTVEQLDAVSGGSDGGTVVSGWELVTSRAGGDGSSGGGGGSGTTPAGAWNDLLHNYGYPRMV